jgi:hypothetical protein
VREIAMNTQNSASRLPRRHVALAWAIFVIAGVLLGLGIIPGSLAYTAAGELIMRRADTRQ